MKNILAAAYASAFCLLFLSELFARGVGVFLWGLVNPETFLFFAAPAAGGIAGALAYRAIHGAPPKPVASAAYAIGLAALALLGALGGFFTAAVGAATGVAGFLVSSLLLRSSGAPSGAAAVVPEMSPAVPPTPSAPLRPSPWLGRLALNIVLGNIVAGAGFAMLLLPLCGLGSAAAKVATGCRFAPMLSVPGAAISAFLILLLVADTFKPAMSVRAKVTLTICWVAFVGAVHGGLLVEEKVLYRRDVAATAAQHAEALAELARYEADPSAFPTEECWISNVSVQNSQRWADGAEEYQPTSFLKFGVTFVEGKANWQAPEFYLVDAGGIDELAQIVRGENLREKIMIDGGFQVFAPSPQPRARCYQPKVVSPLAGVRTGTSNVVIVSVLDADGQEITFNDYLMGDFVEAVVEEAPAAADQPSAA
jgi:hypothetical protein